MGNIFSIICQYINENIIIKKNDYENLNHFSYIYKDNSNNIFELNNCHNCKRVFIRNKHTLLCDNCYNNWEIIV